MLKKYLDSLCNFYVASCAVIDFPNMLRQYLLGFEILNIIVPNLMQNDFRSVASAFVKYENE